MKILSQAPSRISLFGGGTDISTYANKYGGICINFAINIRQRVILEYPSTKVFKLIKGDDPKFLKEVIKAIGKNRHIFGISHEYDGEIESGLGSSASYIISLIGAINKLNGVKMNKWEVAEKAFDIEVNKLSLFGGSQDHFVTSIGGINIIEYGKKGKTEMFNFNHDLNAASKLVPYILLFHTGIYRQKNTLQNKFKKLDSKTKNYLDEIAKVAEMAVEPIAQMDYKKIADLLGQSWELKKKSNPEIANSKINYLYDMGIKNGAMAGKLLGSGGGGYMIFMVNPNKQKDFINKMSGSPMKWVDFSLDYNGLDVRIL